MARRTPRTGRLDRRRMGGTLVELALVASIFFLFLFGLIEYCRLVFVRQVMMNAAREGARYAVANVTDASVVGDAQNVVKTRMCGLDNSTTYYNCQVYKSNSSGTSTGSAGDAAFGEYICVQIDYDYAPSLPSFLKMGSSFRITAKDIMYSEAN